MERLRGSGGNALVESAIVLPVWLILFLCTLQLALLGRARLLTEYAAYRAARAGILWNGDPVRMQRAAIHTLRSSACPTRVATARPLCSLYAVDGGASALEALSADPALAFPGVHVHILSPHWPSHGALFDEGEELDFDRFGPEPARRDATLLTLQLQYWFELKIPFADGIVWRAWRAMREGASLLGVEEQAIHRSSYEPVAERAWRAMLRQGDAGRGYFVPVIAHATQGMQSNFFARFVRDCSCHEGSGCSASCRAW